MSDALDYLESVISTGKGGLAEHQWEDVLGAVDVVFAEPLSRKVEHLMLAVLRFGGELRLAESSELPHSMPPEAMIKSFAVQWLARETGLTHLPEMQRVEATAVSPVLASVVRATIRETALRQTSKNSFEAITLLRSPRRRKTLAGALGRGIGQRPRKAIPVAKQKLAATQQSTPGNYIVYRIPVNPDRKSFVSKAVILDQGLLFFAGSHGTLSLPEEEAAIRKVAQKGVLS